jgi:hypothetical protein
MGIRFLWMALAALATVNGASNDYLSAKRKFDDISSDRLRPGTRVTLSLAELNAWVAGEAPTGVRNTRLAVSAPGVATGTAMVDFGKLERGQGGQPGWLMSKLLEGERPVSVTAHIKSSGGLATVDVDRVEVAGIQIDGRTLDFLIRNFVLPIYPEAAIGRPFELGHRVEHLEVQPAGVAVAIGR